MAADNMDNMEIEILTPIKAIRKKCLQCNADQVKDIELCPLKECALYPYRMGNEPEELNLSEKGKQDNIVKSFNQTYHANNNPTKEFATSLDDDEILGKTISEIKAAFYEWMGDDSVTFSSKEFKAAVDVARNFEIKQCKVEGKNKRVYCKITQR